MSHSAPHNDRTRQILAAIVRAYIETGEPVSSRSISRRHVEALSSATIRNVMADLEEEGFLYQPHTSAGRVPTATAYRFFAQQVAAQARLSPEDEEWIRGEFAAATTAEEIAERAGHVLAAVSRGLGIVVSPPIAKTVLEHVRFVLLPDGRVVVVLVSTGGNTRDKIIRPERVYSQTDLDRTADYLNRQYVGRTLESIRADLLARVAKEQERYDLLVRDALALCDPGVLEHGSTQRVYIEGAAQMATAHEFTDQAQLREVLIAIEEKHRLIALLAGCIDTPDPVHVQIGVKGIDPAGEHLALISAPYSYQDQSQGTVGVLGPMRMHYERAITAVAFVARVFSETLDRG
ncbi:MAG: heat-inducible transcriptional repressor HrcA [Candidatus Acidiferrales bacterium]|jgi:heat-inducible transcriptional repressor